MIETLLQFGLNEREATIYLAVLELGESTVLPIAQKAGLKRTYCYDILENLQDKQLVSFTVKNNRRRYSAVNPKYLKQVLKEKEKNLDLVLPELLSIYNQLPSKPVIKFYEGLEGIKQAYKYQESLKVQTVDAICSPNHIEETLGDFFIDFADKMKKNTKIRELIVPSGKNARYLQSYTEPLQEVRFLPEGTNIDTDLALFDDKLLMTSYGKNLHAVIMQSASIVDTHRMIFNQMWKNAEKS